MFFYKQMNTRHPHATRKGHYIFFCAAADGSCGEASNARPTGPFGPAGPIPRRSKALTVNKKKTECPPESGYCCPTGIAPKKKSNKNLPQ